MDLTLLSLSIKVCVFEFELEWRQLEGSVCQVAAYLVVSDEGLEDLERDDMKKDVSVGADCIDWGVLPCLEPIAIEQVVGLQRQWLSQFVSKCWLCIRSQSYPKPVLTWISVSNNHPLRIHKACINLQLQFSLHGSNTAWCQWEFSCFYLWMTLYQDVYLLLL